MPHPWEGNNTVRCRFQPVVSEALKHSPMTTSFGKRRAPIHNSSDISVLHRRRRHKRWLNSPHLLGANSWFWSEVIGGNEWPEIELPLWHASKSFSVKPRSEHCLKYALPILNCPIRFLERRIEFATSSFTFKGIQLIGSPLFYHLAKLKNSLNLGIASFRMSFPKSIAAGPQVLEPHNCFLLTQGEELWTYL